MRTASLMRTAPSLMRAAPGAQGCSQSHSQDHSQSRLCLAQLLAPHGLRGLMWLRSFAENPEDISAYSPLEDEEGRRCAVVAIKTVQRDGARLLVALEGIAHRDAAEKWRGRLLYLQRARLAPLPEETYYQADLIGLEARDAQGQVVGRIREVADYGAGPVLKIIGSSTMIGSSAKDQEHWLPFTKTQVPQIHLSQGYCVVHLARGPEDLPVDAASARDLSS